MFIYTLPSNYFNELTIGARVYSVCAQARGIDIDILIYLSTAIGLSPGGRSTVHIYTQTINGTIQNKQYIEQIVLSVRYTSPGSGVYLMDVIFPAIVVKAARLPKVLKARVQLTSEPGCMFILADFGNAI